MSEEKFIGYVGDYKVHDSRLKYIICDEEDDVALEVIAKECIIK